MNRDGSDAHAVSKEDFRLANNACWTPDGNYLIAKKHFTSRRSLGAGEIQLYHISGGKGLQLTKRKNDQQDVGEPCISPDGKYIYFSEDMASGGFFQYNKDSNSGIYWIRRIDRETGEVKNIIRGSGGAVRPQISPDGKKKLTTKKGYYFAPSFSQDGQKIVFRRGTGNSVFGFTHSKEPEPQVGSYTLFSLSFPVDTSLASIMLTCCGV